MSAPRCGFWNWMGYDRLCVGGPLWPWLIPENDGPLDGLWKMRLTGWGMLTFWKATSSPLYYILWIGVRYPGTWLARHG
ncbi:hypothetical protein LY78DRAFT_196353 [Colletotrichum sublineola]|nr:hypothetical protein LY78DRAFT_196353 [Colletotrichum sublineola]